MKPDTAQTCSADLSFRQIWARPTYQNCVEGSRPLKVKKSVRPAWDTETADVTMADTLTTQRDMSFKLSISQDFELTNRKISVYFSNIGLIQKLIQKLMSRYGIDCWGVCNLTKRVYFDKRGFDVRSPNDAFFNVAQ